MFRHILVKACQILVGSADGLAEAVGMEPKEPTTDPVYEYEKNIAWGKDWVHQRMEATASGEPFRLTPQELVMLIAVAASILLLRQAALPNGPVVVGKLVSRLAV